MKAQQLKRIVNFILQHNTNQTNASIRALLKTNPEQFLDLLNDAIDQADVVPASVVNFIKEVSKQTSPKQAQPTKENPTMTNQKKTSIIVRLVAVIKGAWAKAVQILTNNTGKIKVVASAVALVAIALLTNKGTAILTLLAAIKSKGLINSIMNTITKVLSLFSNVKEYALVNLWAARGYLQLGGVVLLIKIIALKNFIVAKAKQAWGWVLDLFSVTAENEPHLQAA
jgi:hypothetical protein